MLQKKLSWFWIGLMISVFKAFNTTWPIMKTVGFNALIAIASFIVAKLIIWNWAITEPATINFVWFAAVFAVYLVINNQLRKSELLFVISNLSLINFSVSIMLITLFILNRFNLTIEAYSTSFSWSAMVMAFIFFLCALENRLQVMSIKALIIYRSEDYESSDLKWMLSILPKIGFILILLGFAWLSLNIFLKPEFEQVWLKIGGTYIIFLGICVWIVDIIYAILKIISAYLSEDYDDKTPDGKMEQPSGCIPHEPINFGY